MRRKIGTLFLAMMLILTFCLPVSVMAATVATCGFYNVETADNVEIEVYADDEPAGLLPIHANDDDVVDWIYDYSDSLKVTLSETVSGQYYAATLVKGTALPENPADFLFTKQVTATEDEVIFNVAGASISENTALTLFITSNDADFTRIAIPLFYAVENMYEVADSVQLPGTVTVAKSGDVISATITGAPSADHYDIVWMRDNSVIKGASDLTYTVQASDAGTTIKAKLVAKGNIYVGEVVCARGIKIPNAGGGGGGGGSEPMYGITVQYGEGGTASVNTKSTMAGNKVKVTVQAKDGYVASAVTVSDNKGNAVEVTNENEVYTFVMPKSAVTVTVAFIKAEDVKPDDKPDDVETVSFADVKEESFYYDAVLWAVTKGITQGISETAFAPEDSCTRAQMITFLWRAAGEPKAANAENVFTDVAKGSYYYDAVLWAVEKGITAGTTETTFSPDAKVDRAQTVTFMYRMAGEPAPVASDASTDVAPTAYYNNAVNWAVTSGITKGTGVGTFSPADVCTRGQIVTFMYRYLAK